MNLLSNYPNIEAMIEDLQKQKSRMEEKEREK
jgi:hypothetical protein